MQQINQGALQLALQITGNRDDALDALQNALLKSMEHHQAPKPEEDGYRAWFYRVVHNQAIDCLRRRKRFSGSDALPEQLSDEPEPAVLLDMEQRRLLLHRALNSLKSEQREIICLKDFHDFSYAEIASIMNIEQGTVMSRLHRARSALKDKLKALQLLPGADHEL